MFEYVGLISQYVINGLSVHFIVTFVSQIFIVNTQFDYVYFYVRDRWIINVHCNISATGNLA